MNVKVQVDMTKLSDTIREYVKATGKDVPESCNRAMRNLFIKAKPMIPYTSADKIEADLLKLPKKVLVRYALAAAISGKIKFKGFGGAAYKKMSRQRKGDKIKALMSSQEMMKELIDKYIKIKKSHAGYIYHGWKKAFSVFGVKGGTLKTNSKPVPGSAGFKASEETKAFSQAINNANAKRFDSKTNGYQQNVQAIERAIPVVIDDMKAYIAKKLKENYK